MSCTETETLLSSSDAKEIDADIRQRKTARIDEPLTALTKNELRPRRVCRRHSYAFRCIVNEVDDENGDEGKHYESVLLVKVIPAEFRVRNLIVAGFTVGEDGGKDEES